MNENQNKTYLSDPFQSIETWIFDLDNTLYPASSRLFDQIDRKITEFIMRALDLNWDDAHRKQKSFFREYGTTMSGMMRVHGTSPEEYLNFVHDIDLSPIPSSPDLDQALDDLPGRKVIFTNGSTDHARNVTEKLGITSHYDSEIDIIDSIVTLKPDPGVYESMVRAFAINPKTAVMIEDMARNLEPAATLGMTTVWIRTEAAWASEGSGGDHIHHTVDDLVDWLKTLTVRRP